MGRNKEFNEEQAIRKAMFLFWQQGYEKTSLKDLLQELQILNGSFYYAFGNKKKLFMLVMKTYVGKYYGQLMALFESKLPIEEKLKILFFFSIERSRKEGCPRGCFLFNSISNMTVEDADIKDFILKVMVDFEKIIAKDLRRAQKAGEICADLKPALLSQMIVTYLQGLMQLSLLNWSEARLKKQVECFIASLRLS